MEIENILMNSMGFNQLKKNVEASTERFDSFDDSVYSEYIQAQENLEFIDTFERINNNNVNQKLKMLKKINKDYGNCNKGLENYCRIQSLEAEVEGTSAKKEETKSEDKSVEQPAGASEQKKKWYQKVWEAIKTFFKKIGNFFKMIWNKITGLFKKHADTDEAIEKAREEQLAKLDEYLDKVQLPSSDDDSSKGYIIINDKVVSNLTSAATRYVKLCTQFDAAITELTAKKGSDQSIKKFIEMAKIYLDDNSNISGASNNESLLKVLNNLGSRKYDRAKDPAKFGTSIKETTKIKDIIGTNNSKTISKKLKEVTNVISQFNKSMDQAEKLCANASNKFNDYITKNESNDDESNKIAVALFKAVTKVADINRGLASDLAKSVRVIKLDGLIKGAKEILGVAGAAVKNAAIKLAGGMKKLSKRGQQEVSKLIQSARQAYLDELDKKEYRDLNAALMSSSIKRLIEDISRAYVNDSSYYSKSFYDFQMDVVRAIKDNGYYDILKEKFGDINLKEYETIMNEVNVDKLREAYDKVKNKQATINRAEQDDIQHNLQEKENR